MAFAVCLLLASSSSALSLTATTLPRVRLSSTNEVFEAAVDRCTGSSQLSGVPHLLRQVFTADFDCLLAGNGQTKVVQNVTCMRPADADGMHCFDEELLGLKLEPGRRCGTCSDACSRVLWPELASPAECTAFLEAVAPLLPSTAEHPHHNMYLSSCCAAGDARAILWFIRLVERARRAVAHEYGLQLSQLKPRQAFLSRIATKADEDRQSVHCDESSFAAYHYSSVLYLTSQGAEFEGGGFSFVDPPSNPHPAGQLRDVVPRAGAALTFSAGWENMHVVRPLLSGCRVAVPIFFETQDQEDVLVPGDDAEIARSLWRLALCPQTEDDVRQLMRHWHHLFS